MITSSQTISTGIGSLNMFATLMGHKGLSLYNKELNATSLTGIEQISVFDFWTKFYTDYGYQKEADFYNRFRAGGKRRQHTAKQKCRKIFHDSPRTVKHTIIINGFRAKSNLRL